jgi:diguanylate cyclase (GGDEF)-like protein
LHNGDKIQLGDVVFKFLVQDALEQEFHRHVHRLIHFDQLTGLMTMESFRKVLDDAIERARHGTVFSLAMTDLDGLKRVNDTLGHLAGRHTIAAMGAFMRETLRPVDRAGLYGGDEGIVLFPGAPLGEAALIAEQLRLRIEKHAFEYEGQPYRVTISQGLAEWPLHGPSPEALIAAADSALYTAKADGRNCVRLAPPPNETLASSQRGD